MDSVISVGEFFRIILPFLFLILIIKSFISSSFLIYPGDLIFAFAIAILTFRNSGFLLYSLLFVLGLLEGLDFLDKEIFLAIYFVVLGLTWKHLRKFFVLEKLGSKIIIWVLSILSFLLLRYIFFFYKLNVPLNWMIILNLAVKSFYYICITLIWVLVFNKVLAGFFYKET